MAVVLPAMAGFIAGAVFWHLVGFWGFVDKVVYSKQRTHVDDTQTEAIARPAWTTPASAIITSSTAPAGCSALVLDRTTAITRSAPCETGMAAAAPGLAAPRGDAEGALKAAVTIRPPADGLRTGINR